MCLHLHFNSVSLIILVGNCLVSLPKGLGGMVSLKKFYIHNNSLTKLHSSLGRCFNIEVINVENNRLTKVAKRIGELPKLKHLLLAGNQLESLPFNLYEKAPGLRRLTLSGNKLSPDLMKLERQSSQLSVMEEEEAVAEE